MNPIITSIIVFVCTFGGVLLGMFLRAHLPEHHFSKSAEVLRLGTAIMGTMAALLLGLQLESARDSFNALSDEVSQASGDIILLDRTLAQYGPEAQPVREILKAKTERVLEYAWSTRMSSLNAEGQQALFNALLALSPKTDAQTTLKSHAIDLAFTVGRTRWLITAKETTTASVPLITVLIVWFTVIFIGFGLLTPRNTTVTVSLCVLAASISAAVFLLLELYTPFSGVLRVSDAPLRTAVGLLGR
jgi:hypothetical protein